MSDVRLCLIGGFELTIDGDPVELQPASRRLLAFVALLPRGVERMFAALQLWPEHSEDRAKANLRSALWRLNKVDAPLVVSTKTHLQLDRTVWVDVRHGMDALATADDDGIAPFASIANELLPDWYDDWLMIERERLRQLTMAGLEDKARRALDDDDTAVAIQFALRSAAVDPARESAHRLVIEAQLAEGNQCAARRSLTIYRGLLTQLGLEPSDELEQLASREQLRLAG